MWQERIRRHTRSKRENGKRREKPLKSEEAETQ